MELRDLVIVGGGPAGAGTALWLERINPELARRAVVLDRAVFPRDKTCAGGLIPQAITLLRRLGLGLDVPHVRVDLARALVAGRGEGKTIEVESPGCCWIIRRREFDAMLLEAARQRGIEVREGVKLDSVRRDHGRIVLSTSCGEIAARALVGADGSGSLVRRELVDERTGRVARAVMCDVPIEGASRAPSDFEFDFRPVPKGLAGYLWSFPCLIEGRPHWNVGAYSMRRRGEGERLAQLLDRRTCRPDLTRKAHPIRLYDPRAVLSSPGVLLTGDAAGVDALLGEGISIALEYGELAARALARGFACGDLSFAGYSRAVARSPMGRKLRRLAFAARLFYGRHGRFWFGMAQLSQRAQKRSMAWYNGGSQWQRQ